MRIFLFLLVAMTAAAAGGTERLYLNPSAECGIFTTLRGEWSACPASEVKLSYDDSKLIVDAVLRLPEGSEFQRGGNKDDDMAVFNGEVFEWQIAPGKTGDVYWHLALSPSGFLYSARKTDMAWNPAGLLKKNIVRGNEWTFRLEMPYRLIRAAKPSKGEIWRMNLARTARFNGKSETASFSGAANFHAPDQFAEVIFGEDTPEKNSVLLRSADTRKQPYVLTFSSARMPEQVKLDYYSGEKPAFSGTFRTQNGMLTAEIPIEIGYFPLKSAVPSRVELRDAATGRLVGISSGIVATGNADSLTLDRFYYTPADGAIRFRHSMGKDMTLRLTGPQGEVFSAPCPKENGSIPFALPGISSQKKDVLTLAPGRYVLELTNGKSRTSRVFFILKNVPETKPVSAPQQLRVSGEQLQLNGKPVFLIGLSSTPKVFFQFGDAHNLRYETRGVRKDAVQLAGIPDARLFRKPFTGRAYPPDDVHAAKSADFVRKIKNTHPAFFRISYEAQIPKALTAADGTIIPGDTDELMFKTYQAVKLANPELVYSIQTDNPAKIASLSKACDVFEVALYSSSYAQNMLPNLQRDMTKVRSELSEKKPVIYWLGGTIPDNQCRRAEEIRAGVYLSILNGFSGNIIHMGHGFLPETRTRLWSLLSGILYEVETFYPQFAAGSPLPGDWNNGPVIAAARQLPSGEIMLIAVNTSAAEAVYPLRKDYRIRRLSGETVPNGSDVFTPYEPKVFLLSKMK